MTPIADRAVARRPLMGALQGTRVNGAIALWVPVRRRARWVPCTEPVGNLRCNTTPCAERRARHPLAKCAMRGGHGCTLHNHPCVRPQLAAHTTPATSTTSHTPHDHITPQSYHYAYATRAVATHRTHPDRPMHTLPSHRDDDTPHTPPHPTAHTHTHHANMPTRQAYTPSTPTTPSHTTPTR